MKRYLLRFRIVFVKKSLSRTEHGMYQLPWVLWAGVTLVLLTFRSSGLGDVILWKQTEEALSAHHQARHHCGERILLILCCSQIWRRGNIEVPSSLPASPPPLLLWQGAWLASPLLVTQRQGLRWTRPCFFTSLFAVSGSAVFLLLLLTYWLKAAQGECRVLDSLDWQTACFSSILWCQRICVSQGHFAKFTCQKPRILFALHLCACNSVIVM